MNRQELNALINKRIKMSGGEIPEEVDEYATYNEYEPQNIAADWFEKPEWRLSKGEAEDAREGLLGDMALGMGSIGKVSSMLTPEAQALRNFIKKKNAIEKAGEEGGKLIKVEGGDLGDIRRAQRDFGSKREKILDDFLMSVRRGEKDILPEQIPQLQKLIQEYNSYNKDGFYDNLIKRFMPKKEEIVEEVVEIPAKILPFRKK